jgi:hypothetical protein
VNNQNQANVVKRYYSKSRKRRQGVDKSLSNPRNPPFNPNVLSMNVKDQDYIKLKESIQNQCSTSVTYHKSSRQGQLINKAMHASRNERDNNSLQRYITASQINNTVTNRNAHSKSREQIQSINQSYNKISLRNKIPRKSKRVNYVNTTEL